MPCPAFAIKNTIRSFGIPCRFLYNHTVARGNIFRSAEYWSDILKLFTARTVTGIIFYAGVRKFTGDRNQAVIKGMLMKVKTADEYIRSEIT